MMVYPPLPTDNSQRSRRTVLSYTLANALANVLVAGALVTCTTACLPAPVPGKNTIEGKLLSVTAFYDAPQILIGYDHANKQSSSLDDVIYVPSQKTLEKELAEAHKVQDRQWYDSLRSALRLASLCEDHNLKYQFAPMMRSTPYFDVVRSGSSPTIIIYSLPQVDQAKARAVEEVCERRWRTKNELINVRSFTFSENELREIPAKKEDK